MVPEPSYPCPMARAKRVTINIPDSQRSTVKFTARVPVETAERVWALRDARGLTLAEIVEAGLTALERK
jgi:ribosomal protein L13E